MIMFIRLYNELEKTYMSTMFYLEAIEKQIVPLQYTGLYDKAVLMLEDANEMLFKCSFCLKRSYCLTKQLLNKGCRWIEVPLEVRMEGIEY